MDLQAVFFYLFAFVAVASAFMVISARNPVHSVLFLILTFFNAAGLFLLTGAEFLAMILLVVYVGAVAVLFLFVVMMLDVDFAELKSGALQYAPIGALVGLILAAELIVVHRRLCVRAGARRDGRAADPGSRRRAPTRRRSATSSTPTTSTTSRSPASILLVAMIGAIVLTLRHKAGRQAADDRRPGRPHAGDRRSKSSKVETGEGYLTMVVGIAHYLTVSAILFTLGVFGIFLNRKNVIVILMSIELILLAVNINFVAFSAVLGDLVGQVFALFVLTVAAAEAAIGLAILVVFFRNRGSIAVEDVNMMKG